MTFFHTKKQANGGFPKSTRFEPEKSNNVGPTTDVSSGSKHQHDRFKQQEKCGISFAVDARRILEPLIHHPWRFSNSENLFELPISRKVGKIVAIFIQRMLLPVLLRVEVELFAHSVRTSNSWWQKPTTTRLRRENFFSTW